MNNYQKVLSKLYLLANQSKSVSYTLDNVYFLYQQLNCPGKTIPMIHIAGTNGKGSVSYKMAKSLFDSGYKTALFTSPHISSFRERMQINFKMISQDEFVEVIDPLFSWIENNNIKVSFFELLVLASFQYFERNKVDVAVIETGLGGRLDATNIIYPILSVIVSIGLDHCHILGNTLDEIAFEKGGIIKSSVPVVIGPSAQLPSIFKIAKKNHSPCYLVEDVFSSFDLQNQLVAKKGLSVLMKTFQMKDSTINQAISIRPPCRMEEFMYLDKQVILDVGHNVSGLMALKESLFRKYPKKSFEIYLAVSRGKDTEGICQVISSIADKIHLIEENHPRLEAVDQLVPYLQKKVQIHRFFPSILDQLENSLLVCGSFFIMSKVRRALNQIEPTDEMDLNEKAF